MKGVLFSADFVEDNSGNYKLLELNTDTGVISSSLNTNFDFTELKQVLADKNITEIHTVYKEIQNVLVDKIESEVEGTSVTTFTRYLEDVNTVYPTQPHDQSNYFIIRMAYDEGALFDSTYCKERINPLALFHENSDTGSIPAFYYSGSSQTYNTLINEELNDHAILPDFVEKNINQPSQKVKFLKGGNGESSSIDRTNDVINNYLNKDAHLIEKLYFNSAQISTSNKVQSIRVFYIAYFDETDSDYKLIKLADYKINSITELPSSVNLTTNAYNAYDIKHYHEFATNWPDAGDAIGFNGHGRVYSEDGSLKLFSDILPNDRIKSFFISGSPITDEISVFEAWSHTGTSLPEPFFITSSYVEVALSSSLHTAAIGEIKIGSDESLYSGLQQHYLIHESSSNQFKFLKLLNIDKDNHSLVDQSGSMFDIVDTNLLLIEEDDLLIYNPDVEEQDTYLVSASTPFIVHNAPCFIAGTKVRIEEKGITNIEDVVVGDKVASYNHVNDKVEYNEVLKVRIQEDKEVVTYVFENGTKLSATPDHPLYVFGKDYSSYNPEKTKEDSGLDVRQIAIGDKVLHMEGLGDDEYGVIIEDIIEEIDNQTVYNLEEVANHHNFFVEDLLAHNRWVPCCFRGTTNVQLESGEGINIKDIKVGDFVYSYNLKYEEQIPNKVLALHNTTKLSDHISRNESVILPFSGETPKGMGYFYLNNNTKILFTPEHPFLTKEGWKALAPDASQEPFVTEQEPKTLELGDYICEGKDKWIIINKIDFLEVLEDEIVYNITVEDTHTYMVDGIIVHNK